MAQPTGVHFRVDLVLVVTRVYVRVCCTQQWAVVQTLQSVGEGCTVSDANTTALCRGMPAAVKIDAQRDYAS